MTKARKEYRDTFMAETAALIELFGSLLHGSGTAEEINRRADHHFANLKDAASRYWKEQRELKEIETVVTETYCGRCQRYSDSGGCDPDCDLERQRLREEVRQAYLNGGRTGYLYDIDGNEYYTTRDGIRHYTRVEG